MQRSFKVYKNWSLETLRTLPYCIARNVSICAALMKSAREELQRRELNAQTFQSLESHLAKMHLETDSMRSKALELRVKTAILGNRFVRLDNPILMAKTRDLAAKLAAVMDGT